MAGYVEQQNIYWAFSSSAQAVAAFIGFICAGFFFSHDRMDRRVDKDETLLEIYADIKKKHFKKLRVLLWLTGSSIILSLLIVFVNGFDTGPLLPVSALLVALLNGYTVLSAVLLVIDMVDPKNVEKTADKLIQELSGEYAGGSQTQTLPVSVFIQKFAELEQLAEKLLAHKNATNRPHLTGYSSFSILVKELEQLRILSRSDLQMLNRVFRMKNLLVHGMTKSVSLKDFTELEMLINIFKNLLDN